MPRTRPHPAKALIVARGETIKEVASTVGVGADTLYLVLSGRARPWPALTARLAEHLHVEEEKLWLDDAGLAQAARDLVERSCRDQGLPVPVGDAAVLDRVAKVLEPRGAA